MLHFHCDSWATFTWENTLTRIVVHYSDMMAPHIADSAPAVAGECAFWNADSSGE